MKLRGQSALEYLVTYGWAILAIVIIAAVLWYTGVFNPSKFRGGSECGGFGSFTCIDQVVTTATGTNNVTIVLGNALGRSLTISGTAQDDSVGDLDGTGSPINCGADNGNGATGTAIGATGKLYISCVGAGLTEGDAYDWVVSITFTDSQSSLQKVDTGGFVRGKVGA